MKNSFKSNYMFAAAAAMLGLVLYIGNGSDVIGRLPFSETEISNPVSVHVSGDKRYYISDDSSVVTVTDSDDRVLYSLEGDGSESSFSSASELETGSDGSIYIHDTVLNESGSYAVFERIMRFEPNSSEGEILYELETESDGAQVCGIKGLAFADGVPVFALIDSDGITVMSLGESGEFEEYSETELSDAFRLCSDAAVGPGGELAFALMNGDVYTVSETGLERIYSARAHDTSDYFSIISELDYDNDGTLYMNDIGLREVYRVDGEGTYTVIPCGMFAQLGSDLFSEKPQYSGLDVSEGTVAVSAAEYIYDSENDVEIYHYSLGAVDSEGNELFNVSYVKDTVMQGIYVISIYAAILALLILLIFAAVKAAHLFTSIKPAQSVKMQLVMVCTALAVTCSISYIVFDRSNDRFINEAASNLTNVSYLIGDKLDKELLRSIDSPDDYFNEDYGEIDASVMDILKSKVNENSALYCVVYGVKNDIVCELYRDGVSRGAMYPMAGRYGDSIEEYISENNDYDVSYEFAFAEGTYMYALVPVYDSSGDCVAFIETGTDYNSFTEENRQLYTHLLMLTAMAVIIIMLMISEFMFGGKAVKEKRLAIKRRTGVSPEVIRPLAFMFFFIANLSTAFLPIYGRQLWDSSFPVSAEIAAAFPLSAELIFAAVTAFVFGFVIRKTGIRSGCILGAIFYIAGNLISAFAGSLFVLICANSLCGIGSGILSIAFNTWAAGYETESDRNRGFIHVNAAYLAGLNCGTVIGSVIWEYFGIMNVYIISAVCAAVLGILSAVMIGRVKLAEDEKDESGKRGSLKELFTPRVLRFFICISAPYLICTAFLEYFFPLEAEASGLSAMHISLAFLISGLISIYTGSSLAEPITAKMGTKKAMLFASFLYAAALFYLVFNPSVYSCYVVVILFAIADSFGLSAQSVYYSSLPEVERVGQSKALGVNNTVESITSACGSLIFGAALLLGTQRGIFVIALGFALLTAAYAVFDGRRRNNSRETEVINV